MLHGMTWWSILTALIPGGGAGQLFGDEHWSLPQLEGANHVELADLTGDGLVDILLLPAQLLVNRGDGRFEDKSDGLPPNFLGEDLALGDVDNDGDLDVFIVRVFGGNRLYLNKGDGVFKTGTGGIPAGTFNGHDVVMGDVNGDGNLDVVIASAPTTPGTTDTLLLGDGTGAFSQASNQLPPNNQDSFRVALGDADGDGDLDIYMVAASANALDRLYMNDGQGVFADAANPLPLIGGRRTGVEFVDLDGDGALDIYLCGGGIDPDHVLINTGAGAFVDSGAWLPSNPSSIDVAISFLDGDDRPDVILVTGASEEFLINDGSGALVPSSAFPVSAVPPSMDVAAADIDGDNDVDIFIARGGSISPLLDPQSRLYLNDGHGAFTDVTSLSLPRSAGLQLAAALGDLDGDGDLDLVMGAGEMWLSRNDGTGQFSANEALLPGRGAGRPAIGDMDGDGDDDLYLALIGQNELLLNNGCGGFSNATWMLPVQSGITHEVALGDLNGDGALDVFLGQTGTNLLTLSDGLGGYFDASSMLPVFTSSFQTLHVDLGDVDGDGDLDVVIGSQFQLNSIHLLINEGSSFSIGSSALPGTVTGLEDVVFADVDGDGDPDLLIGVSSGGLQNLLWRNDGGVFVDATNQLPAIAARTNSLTVIDIDADGDCDLVVGTTDTSVLPGQNLLLLNDGSGFFTDAPGFLPRGSDRVYEIPAGDVDGDGDIDLIYMPRGRSNRLLYNHWHQVAWQTIPRAGRELKLRIHGQAGEKWTLHMTHARSFGACGFDPPISSEVVGSGILPASGKEEVSLNLVPEHLIGETFYFHANYSSPAGTVHSNYERATIAGF